MEPECVDELDVLIDELEALLAQARVGPVSRSSVTRFTLSGWRIFPGDPRVRAIAGTAMKNPAERRRPRCYIHLSAPASGQCSAFFAGKSVQISSSGVGKCG